MPALPNLSTWHPVPVGATIPKDTPYAYVYDGDATLRLEGSFVEIIVRKHDDYYTEHPVTTPLPTENGTTILASTDSDYAPSILLTRRGAYWTTFCDSISPRQSRAAPWYDYQIAAWAPVTIGDVVVK